MKKFLSTILVLIVAIIPLCTMVAFGYAYTNEKNFSVTMKISGGNTLLTTQTKINANNNFSRVKFYDTSEVNKGYVWIENSAGDMVSGKVYILPDNVSREMTYNNGMTFTKNAKVYFWGEQYNVLTKLVNGTAYTY